MKNNSIHFKKEEIPYLISMLENKYIISESFFDRIKKFPDFFNKLLKIKTKIGIEKFKKIAEFLKSKLKKIAMLKILFLSSSIVIFVSCKYEDVGISKENTIIVSDEKGEVKDIDCGQKSLCFVYVDEEGKITNTKAATLSQEEIENAVDNASISFKDFDKKGKKKLETITLQQLNTEFKEFAKKTDITSGILFYAPNVEIQLKQKINDIMSYINSNKKQENYIFNNIIVHEDVEYHNYIAYIGDKGNIKNYKKTIDDLFAKYKSDITKFKDGVDFNNKYVNQLKYIYEDKHRELFSNTAGFVAVFNDSFKTEKNGKKIFFPPPQIITTSDVFDVESTIRHEIMHVISDFKKLSDLFTVLVSKIGYEESFDLETFYQKSNEILFRDLLFRKTIIDELKKENIHKIKDSLDIALKYFIGLGLIKVLKDESGKTKYKIVDQLVLGQANEKARRLFDLQKEISDNTNEKTFDMIKYYYLNNLHLKSKKLINKFIDLLIENYDNKEIGPLFDEYKHINKEYIKLADTNKYAFLKSAGIFLYNFSKLTKEEMISLKKSLGIIQKNVDTLHNILVVDLDYGDMLLGREKERFIFYKRFLNMAFNLSKLPHLKK